MARADLIVFRIDALLLRLAAGAVVARPSGLADAVAAVAYAVTAAQLPVVPLAAEVVALAVRAVDALVVAARLALAPAADAAAAAAALEAARAARLHAAARRVLAYLVGGALAEAAERAEVAVAYAALVGAVVVADGGVYLVVRAIGLFTRTGTQHLKVDD